MLDDALARVHRELSPAYRPSPAAATARQQRNPTRFDVIPGP